MYEAPGLGVLAQDGGGVSRHRGEPGPRGHDSDRDCQDHGFSSGKQRQTIPVRENAHFGSCLRAAEADSADKGEFVVVITDEPDPPPPKELLGSDRDKD